MKKKVSIVVKNKEERKTKEKERKYMVFALRFIH